MPAPRVTKSQKIAELEQELSDSLNVERELARINKKLDSIHSLFVNMERRLDGISRAYPVNREFAERVLTQLSAIHTITDNIDTNTAKTLVLVDVFGNYAKEDADGV